MSPLIIVVLIVLAVFGSVYMLKPSPRQQRLAALRLEAIKLGLQVKLEAFKPDSKKNGIRDDVIGTRYQRMLPTEKTFELKWRIVRQQGWEQKGLAEGWSWHDDVKSPDLTKLNAFIESLSGDVLLVEAYDNRIGLVSSEGKDTTALQINEWLNEAGRC